MALEEYKKLSSMALALEQYDMVQFRAISFFFASDFKKTELNGLGEGVDGSVRGPWMLGH